MDSRKILELKLDENDVRDLVTSLFSHVTWSTVPEDSILNGLLDIGEGFLDGKG